MLFDSFILDLTERLTECDVKLDNAYIFVGLILINNILAERVVKRLMRIFIHFFVSQILNKKSNSVLETGY